ncbi:MAG: glycosyltransferase, partial [Candidatus Scalindua sp.]|nr:glycosyltransferase [Candidatus Scalindua sp.]
MSSDCQSEDKQTEIRKDTDCRRNKIEQIKSEKEVNKMQTKEMNIKNLHVKKQDCESNNPTISLCMIVKNEEENLAQCLDSVRDFVDEIIIVDTGSTDRTVDIAESYGARVFYHPWEGSFSKARNYSLRYATCDWILILDADEELNKEDTQRLKETAENNECPVISFIIKNKYKDSTQEGYAQMVRLFRNFSGVHYKGIVHNTIQYSGKCLNSSITIIHHGYNLSEDKMEEKFLRTSTLLKEQIKAEPHNPVPYMYLGVAYMDRRKYVEAITNSKRAISLAEEKGFNKKDFLVSYYIVSAAYFEKKEFKDSEMYALKAVELDKQFLDAYCLLSFTYYNLKEYDKFMEASENYLTIWSRITNSYSTKRESPLHFPQKNEELEIEPQTNIIYHTIGHKWKIHLLRGFCHLSSNRNESGNSEIDKAVNESTDMEECLTLLGKFYIEQNNIVKAEDTYRRLLSINQKSVNALFNLGRIKFQKSDLNETLSLWKKAVEIEPTLFDIRLLICKVNIALGNFEDVVVDCDQLLQILNMSRDITIDGLSELANVFNSIVGKLKERNGVQPAETAYRI